MKIVSENLKRDRRISLWKSLKSFAIPILLVSFLNFHSFASETNYEDVSLDEINEKTRMLMDEFLKKVVHLSSERELFSGIDKIKIVDVNPKRPESKIDIRFDFLKNAEYKPGILEWEGKKIHGSPQPEVGPGGIIFKVNITDRNKGEDRTSTYWLFPRVQGRMNLRLTYFFLTDPKNPDAIAIQQRLNAILDELVPKYFPLGKRGNTGN